MPEAWRADVRLHRQQQPAVGFGLLDGDEGGAGGCDKGQRSGEGMHRLCLRGLRRMGDADRGASITRRETVERFEHRAHRRSLMGIDLVAEVGGDRIDCEERNVAEPLDGGGQQRQVLAQAERQFGAGTTRHPHKKNAA